MHKLVPFPVDSWQMVRFASYVGNMVGTVGTVQNYTGGVRKLHDLRGFEVPDFNFKLIIQALRAELARPTKQATAMSPQIIKANLQPCGSPITSKDPEGYTLHCLRRGGCTHALNARLASKDIQLTGVWVLENYLRYVDMTLDRRVNNN